MISRGDKRTGRDEGAMCLLCIRALVSLMTSLLCHRLRGLRERLHEHALLTSTGACHYMCKYQVLLVGFMWKFIRCGIVFWRLVSVWVGGR